MEPSSSFEFSFLQALYKVVEERIPYGRAITTLTTLLVLAAIIVLSLTYLVNTLAPIAGTLALYGEHLVLYARAVLTNRPPPKVPQTFVLVSRWGLLIEGLLLLALTAALFALILTLEKEAKERDMALETRVAKIEGSLKVRRENRRPNK